MKRRALPPQRREVEELNFDDDRLGRVEAEDGSPLPDDPEEDDPIGFADMPEPPSRNRKRDRE